MILAYNLEGIKDLSDSGRAKLSPFPATYLLELNCSKVMKTKGRSK